MSGALTIGTYELRIVDKQTGEPGLAYLEEVSANEVLSNWRFRWQHWKPSTSRAIVKMTYQEKIIGLVKYSAMYRAGEKYRFLNVDNLESIPRILGRPVVTIGRWLMWYVAQAAIAHCVGTDNQTIVFLNSTPQARGFYQDKVMMEQLGQNVDSDGAIAHAFRFTYKQAELFCQHCAGNSPPVLCR